MSWNFARFHEIQFQTEPKNFSFLSWKTKKNIPKKKILSRTAKIDPKDGVSRLNFPEGFGAVQCRALLPVRKAKSSHALIEANPAWKKSVT